MATRSFIIIANPKGDYTGIYCHWDGYPAHVGRILSEHYAKPSQARALVRLGNLSSLGERLEPLDSTTHAFDNAEKGTTVAYHRDRGEEWAHTAPVTKPTLRELIEVAGQSWCEYVHLYWNKHWSFQEIDEALEGKPFIPTTPDTIRTAQEA